MEYKVLGILFDVTKKRYFFEVKNDDDYEKGVAVIVNTVRGQELGFVYSTPRMIEEEKLVLPLKEVERKATEEDLKVYAELRKKSEKAFVICKEKIVIHKLPMKLVEVEYTMDKSKLIFYFTAEGRVDFRQLVKDLAAVFRLRIELRQIGVRDEARILGKMGICGEKLCCRDFINKFDSVSIKMARDQGLVINPSKISGLCGRLLCCIKYEYSQYEETLKDYPAIGQHIDTPMGPGRVSNLSPLNGFLYVAVKDKGVNKFAIGDIVFDREKAHSMKQQQDGCRVDTEKDLKNLEEV